MRLFGFWNKIENKIFTLIVLTTLVSSVAIFTIMYNTFYMLMVDDVRARTDNVSRYVQEWVPLNSFTMLDTQEHESLPLYTTARRQLNRIRQLANVRYLFTAKRNEQGVIIYLIDGLPPGNDDFRHIGDPVEPEILSDLGRCLKGEMIAGDTILNTDWGSIILTCAPKFNSKGGVSGAIVMEYDADALYQKNIRTMLYSVLIAVGIAGLCIVIAHFVLRKVSESFYKRLAYTDVLTGLGSRTAFEVDMSNLEKNVCSVMSGKVGINVVVYDLNRLKLINDHFGHDAGDRYIKKMGEIIRSLPLETASHYRIGGDEFVTFVQGEKLAEVQTRVKSAFCSSRYTICDEKHFEFSYGVAAFDPELDTCLQDTINRADKEMYAFKRDVKSCTVTERETPPAS